MVFIQFTVFILYMVSTGDCKMKPFIVGGYNANIRDFPHSAYIGVDCVMHGETYYWSCGGSIINQYLTLTAAHCYSDCTTRSWSTLIVGVENILEGSPKEIHSFAIHEQFCERSASNDIALVRLKTALTFSDTVNRVALMGRPPYREEAAIAGWGLIDEDRELSSPFLKFTKQYVKERQDCLNTLQTMPKGTICASDKDPSNYPTQGDSGSALVVRGYIQVGLVSYKLPSATNVVVYTDTGYFIKWIKWTADKIMC